MFQKSWTQPFLQYCKYECFLLHKISLKTRQVKLNRCLRPTFFTVNQNIGCRFICVCRGDTRQRAFESPDPGECFTYPHDGCKVSRKFSRDAWRSSASRLVVWQVKSWKIWTSKIFDKNFFWRSKWLEKKFFKILFLMMFRGSKHAQNIPNMFLSCPRHLRKV